MGCGIHWIRKWCELDRDVAGLGGLIPNNCKIVLAGDGQGKEHRTSNVQHRTLKWKKMKRQTYDLEERLLEYSVRIIKIVEQLPNTRVGNHVAGQLLKSGTSPYPNHGEAQAAESPKDFIHKLRIALKELRETERWLKLIQRVPLVQKPELLNDILHESE